MESIKRVWMLLPCYIIVAAKALMPAAVKDYSIMPIIVLGLIAILVTAVLAVVIVKKGVTEKYSIAFKVAAISIFIAYALFVVFKYII